MAFEDPMQAFSFEERKPVLDLLEPGENVLWADRPESTAAFGQANTGVLFSLGWMALIAWLFFFHADNPPWFMSLPFFLAGAWILWKSLERARDVKSTVYVLTERRAMILTPKRNHIYPVRHGMPYDVRETGGGGGDILFDRWEEQGMREKPANADSPKGASKRFRKIGFKDIEQVSVPHAILQKLTT